MARKPVQPAGPAPKLHIDIGGMKAGITRLSARLQELNAFDAKSMTVGNPPELKALETAIDRSLAKTFGEDTADYRRFVGATRLRWSPGMFIAGHTTPLSDYQNAVGRNAENSRALLMQAISTLEEDIAEAEDLEEPGQPSLTAPDAPVLRKAFVVHGHDDAARETAARFLERLGFEAIILHEQANQGRTVIEKIEAHGDVGFAVVLLTPDDEGCVKGGQLAARARQNVLLELGYFLGKLGRDKVCALKKGDVEIPSDFAGVVWENMDASGAWKAALARELQAAGHEIDWNVVMR